MERLINCEKCMQLTPANERQLIACGYETPVDRAIAWKHVGMKPRFDGDVVTTCPGYTTGLPQVLEAAHARLHWQKGELSSFTGDEPASEQLTEAITALEVSSSALEHWLLTPTSQGGGREGA